MKGKEKEPEKRTLKTILKQYGLWNSARLFMVGLVLAIIGRIVAIWDTPTALYIQLFVALCLLGGFMVAEPVRKLWDSKRK